MKSFRKINYSLRPAKAVERRILSFALKKLNHFDHLSAYQYIGFGATTFHDFILFHKELGINKMFSIEESGNKERFNFNKPYRCIEMLWGKSQDILPSVDWDTKSILWLDYDKTIKEPYLEDTSTFFASAVSGSVFLITLSCDPDAYGVENSERRQKIIDSIGENNLFFGNKTIDFSTANLSKSLRRIINAKIQSTLNDRNGGLKNENKLTYKQLFYFNYADGMKMLTIGGLIYNENDREKYDSVNFEEYDFIRREDEAFEIDIPALTMKEIRFLNSQLPNGIDNEGKYKVRVHKDLNPNLPPTDILNYSKVYNFFPLYTEAFTI